MLLRTSVLVATVLSVAALPSAPAPGLRPFGAVPSGFAREERLVADRRGAAGLKRLLSMAAPAGNLRVRGGAAKQKVEDDEDSKASQGGFSLGITRAHVSYLLVLLTAGVFYKVLTQVDIS